jgi:hypothetical protein
MPSIGDKSFPDNRFEQWGASLDALCVATPALPSKPPYVRFDHPCATCGEDYAPFGVGFPKHTQWFCRKHLEEYTCLPLETPSTTTGSTKSDPAPSLGLTFGSRSTSLPTALTKRLSALYGDKSEPSQLTLPI